MKLTSSPQVVYGAIVERDGELQVDVNTLYLGWEGAFRKGKGLLSYAGLGVFDLSFVRVYRKEAE